MARREYHKHSFAHGSKSRADIFERVVISSEIIFLELMFRKDLRLADLSFLRAIVSLLLEKACGSHRTGTIIRNNAPNGPSK